MGLVILFSIALAIIVAIGTLVLIRQMERPQRVTFAVALARRLPTDPREQAFVAVEREFRMEDGVISPGWIIEGSQPAGPTVIITHGLADSRYGSLLRVPMLAPFASRIIVYDLRGHGDSSAKKTTLTLKEPGDLLHLMNEVDNGSPIVLMGHSMGGGISIVTAAMAQDPRIAAVIAEGAYRWPMEPIVNLFRRKRWPVFPFVWLAGQHFSFWLGISSRSFDRASHAAKLVCPLLVVQGAADAICPVASAQVVVAAALRGEIVVVPGAAHADLPILYRDRYLDALRGFFSKLNLPKQI